MLAGGLSAAMPAFAPPIRAADLPEGYVIREPAPSVFRGTRLEQVALFMREGTKRIPTVPARTPYHYCLTGETLLPGEIPPPPEYCCC
jgi:hypothetical protein